jgi:hypothetical protein
MVVRSKTAPRLAAAITPILDPALGMISSLHPYLAILRRVRSIRVRLEAS